MGQVIDVTGDNISICAGHGTTLQIRSRIINSFLTSNNAPYTRKRCFFPRNLLILYNNLWSDPDPLRLVASDQVAAR